MSRPWLVIVHSPALGPSSCLPFARALTERGWGCIVPSLLDATTAADHVELAAAGIPDVDTILVGHSGAGRILPAIAAAGPARTVGYAFVDAGLPPFEGPTTITEPVFASRLTRLAVSGVVPRWSEWFGDEWWPVLVADPSIRRQLSAEMRPLPLTTFTDPVPVRPGWGDTAAMYLRLSPAYEEDATRATRRGWEVERLDGSHLDTVLRPRSTAEALDRLPGAFT